jgi:AcrR family transcriptional regulator
MSPTTTRLPASERREQLLDVTKAIVAARGFHAVSIEAVARDAGVSRPIVYGHFEHLGGLLEALILRESTRALAQLSRVLPMVRDRSCPSGAARRRERTGPVPSDGALVAALRAYLEAVEADPDTWRLVLMPPEGAPSLLRDLLARGRAAVLAQLAEAVRPGLGSGGPSPDPELTARTLSAIADESARLLLTEPERYPVERLVAHAGWVLEQLG